MGTFDSTVLRQAFGSVCALLSFSVGAVDDFELTLNGKVIADSCEIEVVNQVDLGKHLVTLFDQANETPPENFEVKVKNCSEDLEGNRIQIRLDGDADENYSFAFRNNGEAQNVFIELLNVQRNERDTLESDTLEPQSTFSIPLTEDGQGNTQLQARIGRADLGKAVGPGSVAATVTMTVIYDQ